MVSQRLAFYDLRDWWLSDSTLRSVLDLNEEDSPFYPIYEPGDTNPPMIIYEVRKFVADQDWWQHREQIVLQIVSFDVTQVYAATNIMIDMAGRMADSARELSDWMRSEGKQTDFEYHCIEFLGMENSEPVKERGGAVRVTMGFSIDYSQLSGRGISS